MRSLLALLVTSMMMTTAALTLLPGPRPATAAVDASTIEAAEGLAREALALAAHDPQAGLAKARRALALTNEFNPTVFVEMGRKGEVVEDEFQAARLSYGEHRAVLYGAVGSILAAQGAHLAASRYLSRAFLLDPRPSRGLALARVQIALGRGRAALDSATKAIAGAKSPSPEALVVIAQAADVARLPSAQAEIDRGRVKATFKDGVSVRDEQVSFPQGTRLSSTPAFRLEDSAVNLLYVAEASCRHCSADLAELRRLVPAEVRVLIVPEGDDRDAEVRQVLSIYGYDWPLLLGPDLTARLRVEPRSALVVARGGWSAALLTAPFGRTLPAVLEAYGKVDIQETVPRPRWDRRPVDRRPLPPPPGLLEDGLAPGEDEPFPPEFAAAVEAYRAGRYREALKGFDALEARGDGWLLPPEARLDRALCLAGLGNRPEARRILLRTGDSRFEDAIDETLERVAPPGQ